MIKKIMKWLTLADVPTRTVEATSCVHPTGSSWVHVTITDSRQEYVACCAKHLYEVLNKVKEKEHDGHPVQPA